MTVLPFLAITFGAAAASLLLRANARMAAAIGIAGLLAAAAAAARIRPEDTLAIGGSELAGSEYLRLFALVGSLVALALVVLGLASTSHRNAPGVLLAGMGSAVLALALTDARIGVARGDRRRPLRRPRDDRLAGDAPQRRRRQSRAAGARGRGRARDPRHGLDRPAARRPRGRARGLRLRLPRLRGGGRDPVRGDPVPLLGGAPRRRGAGGDAADADGLGSGGVRDRRPHLGRPVGARRSSCR